MNTGAENNDKTQARMLAEIERLTMENDLLRKKVQLLMRRMFGRKSEKLDPAQLEMLLGLEPGSLAKNEDAPAAAAAGRRPDAPRPAAPSRPLMPEHLPVVEEVLEPLEVRANPEAWRRIGEEVTEELDMEPARFVRRRLIRPKYVSKLHPQRPPVIAPLPPRLLDRGKVSASVLAHVAVAKYVNHLPLYRQQQMYARGWGVHLTRQTLARWLLVMAYWMRPIYEAIHGEMMRLSYHQVDETPVRYLCPGEGGTRQGYFWAVRAPGRQDAVWFAWHPSRAAQCLEEIFPPGHQGVAQSDGYAAYDSFAEGRGGKIRLAGCLAHARRGFHDALELGCRDAAWVVRQIGQIYESEAQLRQRRAGPTLRRAQRLWRSAPVMRRLRRVLERWTLAKRHLPQSAMGKAIAYTLNQWEKLELFLEDGRVEVDNNLVENAIRPTALGKKNWLFLGREDAGQTAAINFTIVENCRLLGIDPEAYLREVLKRLPHATNQNVHELTPRRMAAYFKAQAGDARPAQAA